MEIVLAQGNKYLIVVVGPTAVGKTSLCLNLGERFDTEIISADSRQFFKETELGTAKPSQEERQRIVHHLIDNKSIFESYDVKEFESDALKILDHLFLTKDVVILTGGSGLYVDAICQGLDEIPEIDPKIRESVILDHQEKGLVYLQEELLRLDSVYYHEVDLMNPQRLMRAIEVCKGTGKPFSSFRIKKITKRPFIMIKIGLERERQELYDRINIRMDQMIHEGLFQEAEKLFPHKHLNALQTVGYSEIFGYLEGKYDKEEAVRLLKRNSRRYAKRQLTWFRRDTEIHWFHPDNIDEIIEFINLKMKPN